MVWGLEFGFGGSGFTVWGLGFGVWGLGFGFWGLGLEGLGFEVWGLGFGVWGLGFEVWGSELSVQCVLFMLQGSWSGVVDSGFGGQWLGNSTKGSGCRI